jgi:hypothetical protein
MEQSLCWSQHIFVKYAFKIIFMKKLLLLTSLMYTTAICAQDTTVKSLQEAAGKTLEKDKNDTTNKIWKTGAIFGLNVSQGSLSNWAAGGDKFSLSANTVINAHAYYKKDKHSWDNNLDFYLATLKQLLQAQERMMTGLKFIQSMVML